MKQILVLLMLKLVIFCAAAQCQNQPEIDKGWKWIIPLKTQKAEIEKAFGESITVNKDNPFQTYVTEFGKITVIYAREKKLIKECSCILEDGTVVSTFISPYRFKLSELNFDLSKFKKDDTYSPRELSYFSQEKGILIATEIVKLEDGSQVERVFALEYRPTKSSCATAQCKKQTEVDKGWKWIIPLKTQKAEIEKAFGESITKDKNSFSQTYVTDFGKINVAYAKDNKFLKICSCRLDEGTVISAFISLKNMNLSELNFDLNKFKKDEASLPRQTWYLNEKE